MTRVVLKYRSAATSTKTFVASIETFLGCDQVCLARMERARGHHTHEKRGLHVGWEAKTFVAALSRPTTQNTISRQLLPDEKVFCTAAWCHIPLVASCLVQKRSPRTTQRFSRQHRQLPMPQDSGRWHHSCGGTPDVRSLPSRRCFKVWRRLPLQDYIVVLAGGSAAWVFDSRHLVPNMC